MTSKALTKEKSEQLQEVLKALEALKEDDAVPKNIKASIDSIISHLNSQEELSSKIGNALTILDENAEDLNIQPFIRTQIWNISSLLEKLNH